MQELLNSLIQSGMYEKLYKAGLLSPKIMNYHTIHLYVDAQVKTRGIGTEAAVREAEVKFNVGRATVYRAISLFNSDKTAA